MLAVDERSLGELLGELARAGYRFITPTPETHRRVIARRGQAENLRDVFGWSLPFAPETLGPELSRLLDAAGMLVREGRNCKSAVRVSSVGDALFLHSAFPTAQADAVFFGPDSYRFVEFIRHELADAPPVGRLVDIGTGSGVGGIMAALAIRPGKVTLSDINPLALRLARINALHNGVQVEAVEASGVDGIEAPVELAISNPPFMMDIAGRAYRDGGAMHGAALSLDWALGTAAKLAPNGRMLLYTASAIIDGRDRLQEGLNKNLPASGFEVRYREIDPDVFGEQLEEPGYEGVERIAVVGIAIERLQEAGSA